MHNSSLTNQIYQFLFHCFDSNVCLRGFHCVYGIFIGWCAADVNLSYSYVRHLSDLLWVWYLVDCSFALHQRSDVLSALYSCSQRLWNSKGENWAGALHWWRTIWRCTSRSLHESGKPYFWSKSQTNKRFLV